MSIKFTDTDGWHWGMAIKWGKHQQPCTSLLPRVVLCVTESLSWFCLEKCSLNEIF